MAASLIMTACTSSGENQTGASTLTGYEELVGAIRDQNGSEIDISESQELVDQPFFAVKGQILKLEASDVQVFQYASEEARQVDSDQISVDGSSIGTSMITWIDQPNFWAKDSLIVLYVGTDSVIQSILSSVLGDPITQPSTP
jgi:hypothetical protein